MSELERAFRDWMALAYPWTQIDSPDWRRNRAAFEAGYEAGKKEIGG